MLNELLRTPLFGMGLSLGAYVVGLWINRRVGHSLANPFAIAVALSIFLLWATGISYESFNNGGQMLTMFLGPATASLAVSIYRRRAILRRSAAPVLIGCFAGCAMSMASVYVGSIWLDLDWGITVSLLPKSVTTPIAVSLSDAKGGSAALTASVVCLTGMVGNILFPWLLRVMGIWNGVVQGLGLGTASHGIGTARAAEMGDLQCAVSSIAIGIAGVMTTILFLLVPSA